MDNVRVSRAKWDEVSVGDKRDRSGNLFRVFVSLPVHDAKIRIVHNYT